MKITFDLMLSMADYGKFRQQMKRFKTKSRAVDDVFRSKNKPKTPVADGSEAEPDVDQFEGKVKLTYVASKTAMLKCILGLSDKFNLSVTLTVDDSMMFQYLNMVERTLDYFAATAGTTKIYFDDMFGMIESFSDDVKINDKGVLASRVSNPEEVRELYDKYDSL